MTTTEDNKDQGALTVMASAIGATMILRKSPREIAEAGLSALAEAGYTVVKTEVGQKGDRSRAYLRVEGTTWPNPDDPNSVEWVLRYGQPTKSCLLVAASYIGAYRALIDMTQRDRNHRIATLRSARSVEDGTND